MTEKCRIHAACGVSQTPKIYCSRREKVWQVDLRGQTPLRKS
jgi:hypothetical protein